MGIFSFLLTYPSLGDLATFCGRINELVIEGQTLWAESSDVINL